MHGEVLGAYGRAVHIWARGEAPVVEDIGSHKDTKPRRFFQYVRPEIVEGPFSLLTSQERTVLRQAQNERDRVSYLRGFVSLFEPHIPTVEATSYPDDNALTA